MSSGGSGSDPDYNENLQESRASKRQKKINKDSPQKKSKNIKGIKVNISPLKTKEKKRRRSISYPPNLKENESQDQSTAPTVNESLEKAAEFSKKPRFAKQKLEEFKEKKINLSEGTTLVDNLARLIQTTTQGCSAVTIAKAKIFITDNDLGKDNNKGRPKLIKELMQYLGSIKDGNPPDEKTRTEAFLEICMQRIKGDTKAAGVKLEDPQIIQIATMMLNDPHTSLDKVVKQQNAEGESLYNFGSEIEGVGAASIKIMQAKLDLMKIEKFLFDSKNKDSDFTKAIKANSASRIETKYNLTTIENDKGAVTQKPEAYIAKQDYTYANDGKPGYCLVNIDSGKVDDAPRTHAEAQMLDFLLFTDILQKTTEPIYIGISKLCCLKCKCLVGASSQYNLDQGKGQIIVRGEHEGNFNYQNPVFLQNELITHNANNRIQKNRVYQDSAAAKSIKQKYDIIVKEIKNEQKTIVGKHDKTRGKGAYLQQVVSDPELSPYRSPLSKITHINKIIDVISVKYADNPEFDIEARKILEGLKALDAKYQNSKIEHQTKPSSTKNLAAEFAKTETKKKESDVIYSPLWLIDKVKADGNCAFYCILDTKEERDKFNRKKDVVEPLIKEINNKNPANVEKHNKIVNYVKEDMYQFHREYLSNLNSLPKDLPKSLKDFFIKQKKLDSDRNTELTKDKFYNNLDNQLVSVYLKNYFGADDARWPAINGIGAAHAELNDIKINRFEIEKEEADSVTLRYSFSNAQGTKNEHYIKTVNIVHDKSGRHFERLKNQYSTMANPEKGTFIINNPNINISKTQNIYDAASSLSKKKEKQNVPLSTPHSPKVLRQVQNVIATSFDKAGNTTSLQTSNVTDTKTISSPKPTPTISTSPKDKDQSSLRKSNL